MKKIYSFAVAVVAMMAAASCAHEEFDDFQPEGGKVTFTATIGADDVDTKAALGTSENGKPQTVWSAGDKITIHNGEQCFEFETDTAEGSASAEFSYTGDDFSAENGVIAVYPSGEYTADLAAKTVNVTVAEGDQEGNTVMMISAGENVVLKPLFFPAGPVEI